MTDLPEDLGRSIINTIMNTPVSDDKEAERKAEEIEARIVAARKGNMTVKGRLMSGNHFQITS